MTGADIMAPDQTRGRLIINHSIQFVPPDGVSKGLGKILWRGRQWAVTDDGLESLDGGYFIERERLTLNMDEDRYGFPAHMSRKDWVDDEDFATAWLIGLLLYGCKVDLTEVHNAIAAMAPEGSKDIAF